VHSVTTPQPRRTMQIALAGSLHRVIMWLCTQSQLSTTVEAHDADRPAGLAASCHRVAVHSLTAIHHSRGTRCRSPCRACCIVSLWALFQLSATCVQSAPVCESPASGAVTLAVQTSPFFLKKPQPSTSTWGLLPSKHRVAHAAVRPGGLTARCVQSTTVCKSTIP
jgi:hypothetical protein